MNHLLLTFLSVIFVSLTSIAQETKATFFTHNLGKFYLYVNNQLVERAPNEQVQFTSFGNQKLNVKVVFQDHNLKPIYKDIKLKSNKVMVFVIYNNNKKITLDKFDKVKVGNYKPGLVNVSKNHIPEYTGRLGCNAPSSFKNVEIAINQMKNEKNEIAQLTIASSLIKNNCLTVSDLKLVLRSFTYETNRVEFAKYAWPYIYDQENYINLTSIFEYPQTMEEINTFVHSNQ